MAIKMVNRPRSTNNKTEDSVNSFIAAGGTVPEKEKNIEHRLTLRIPSHLIELIDAKRKQRPGNVSRNLWIVEQLVKLTSK